MLLAPTKTSLLCTLLFLLLATQPCPSAPLATARSLSPDARPRDGTWWPSNTARFGDSPFGRGCVGTESLCGVALSRAEESERETLRRDRPPQLWRIPEDEDFARRLAGADPDARLQQYYQRLGGDDYQSKRYISQAELLQLMETYQEQGQCRRLERSRLRQQVLTVNSGGKAWLTRLLTLLNSSRSLASALAKLNNANFSWTKASMHSEQVISRSASDSAAGTVPVELSAAATATATPTLTRRGLFRKSGQTLKLGRDTPSVRGGTGSESADQTAQTIPEMGSAFSFSVARSSSNSDANDDDEEEDKRFHEEMRQRFSRPWSREEGETRDSL